MVRPPGTLARQTCLLTQCSYFVLFFLLLAFCIVTVGVGVEYCSVCINKAWCMLYIISCDTSLAVPFYTCISCFLMHMTCGFYCSAWLYSLCALCLCLEVELSKFLVTKCLEVEFSLSFSYIGDPDCVMAEDQSPAQLEPALPKYIVFTVR